MRKIVCILVVMAVLLVVPVAASAEEAARVVGETAFVSGAAYGINEIAGADKELWSALAGLAVWVTEGGIDAVTGAPTPLPEILVKAGLGAAWGYGVNQIGGDHPEVWATLAGVAAELIDEGINYAQ